MTVNLDKKGALNGMEWTALHRLGKRSLQENVIMACDCSGAEAAYVSLYLYNQIHDPNLRQLPAYGLGTAVGICLRAERERKSDTLFTN